MDKCWMEKPQKRKGIDVHFKGSGEISNLRHHPYYILQQVTIPMIASKLPLATRILPEPVPYLGKEV
jgi:hypothetical protein